MKKRVISAVIALAIGIPIYLIGGIPYALAICILAALGYKEILTLKESHKPFGDFISVLGLICLELIIILNRGASFMFSGISFATIGLMAIVLLIPTIFSKKYTTKDAFYLIGTITLLSIFFTLLIILREGSEWLLVYLILVAIMTDTFAMLIGSLIGKHKLIPSVSPNKSVEGSVAGSLMGTVVGSIFYYFVLTSNIKLIPLILMTLVLTIAGQIGDLLFSKIKRENGIKDFSKIMPGHGGILDRLDSMCFIVITYAIIIGFSTFF